MAEFRGFDYFTDDPGKIKELDAEIANKHPSIYVDQNRLQVDSSEIDPMAAMKKRIIEEYLAQQAAHGDPNRDMGNTVQERLKPANTNDINAITMNPQAKTFNLPGSLAKALEAATPVPAELASLDAVIHPKT